MLTHSVGTHSVGTHSEGRSKKTCKRWACPASPNSWGNSWGPEGVEGREGWVWGESTARPREGERGGQGET